MKWLDDPRVWKPLLFALGCVVVMANMIGFAAIVALSGTFVK